VPVGGHTAGGAIDAVTARLAHTEIVLAGAGDDAVVTGADLGATVDARALAEEVYADHPMWNVSQWFSEPSAAVVSIDVDAAVSALRRAVPSLYVDPTPAAVVFDADVAKYVVIPAVAGQGIDVDAVAAALQDAFNRGERTVSVDTSTAPVEAATTTAIAEASAETLNTMLGRAGFYVGDERAVKIPKATLASWLTVAPDETGALAITADETAIQASVDGLAEKIDRKAVNALVITNSSGKVLKEKREGRTGRELGVTSGIAAAFATQLAAGDAAYALPVTETAFKTTELARTVEVDLGSQRAFLYENGVLVRSYVISSGLPGSPTPAGHFTVGGYSRIQNMGCFDGAPYCVENVPWVTWFAPDIGFHGANSLRSSLGFPQSHGCVNMWDDAAKFVYDWTVRGTEVWVHY
jgi:lipoprotein-anchoring transpeptidase ErfK/SrfK